LSIVCDYSYAVITENNTKFKGIDISVNFGHTKSNFSRELFILNRLIPNTVYINQMKQDYSEAYFYNKIVNLNAALVLNTKPLLLKKHFTTQEVNFGLGYSFINTENSIYYSSTAMPNLRKETRLNFEYQSRQEQLHASYLFLSKTLLNNFKLHFGITGKLNLERIKLVEKNSFYETINYIKSNDSIQSNSQNNYHFKDVNTTLTYFTFIVPLGIRYNIDCQTNVFTELQMGLQYSPILTSGEKFHKMISIGFGIRYKFNEAETEIENGSFW